MLIRSTLHLENFEDLIDFRVTYKQSFSLSHLSVDASNWPYVNGSGVLFGAQQNLGGPIPQRDNLVSISFDGKTEGPRQTKIC